jgi:hypothetical protein
VRGRVYDFDYGSGYLVEGRSGVSVVCQDFVLPSLNTDLAKRLRPRQKLAFKRQPAPLHPQVRLMPARPPISTNGHRPRENGRPALEKLAICESARFSSLARLTGTRFLLNLLMHIKSAKTIALEQRNFALEKFTY